MPEGRLAGACVLSDAQAGEHHSGELGRESVEAKAERMGAEVPRRMGCEESNLAGRRKSDPGKLALAARLRNEATLTMKEIARRVELGTSRGANVRLHEWMKSSARTVPTRAEI